jgi:hypothetical protein
MLSKGDDKRKITVITSQSKGLCLYLSRLQTKLTNCPSHFSEDPQAATEEPFSRAGSAGAS